MAQSHYKELTIASSKVSADVTDARLRLRIVDDADIGSRARRDGRDIKITSSDGLTKLDHELIDYFSGLDRDAAWVWFCKPRAIRHVGSNDKTYVSYQNRAGDVHVCSWDGSSWVHTIMRSALDANDDHSPAALLIRLSDSKVMAWYCAHNGANYYQWISTNAEDASAGSESNLDASLGGSNYSYAQAWQNGGETNDPIYIFYRATDGANKSWYYSKSTDDGSTWATQTKLWQGAGQTPYLLSVQNGAQASSTRIDFVATPEHPENSSTLSVYHFYYDNGTFYDSSGSSISLPISTSNATRIYDGSTDGRAWIWDIGINASGNPVVLYQRSSSTSAHRLRFAEWNGTSWDDYAVVDMGSHIGADGISGFLDPYYAGGAHFDPEDTDNFYVSVQTSGKHRIYKYTHAGSGSFSNSEITSGSEKSRSFRPVCPINRDTSEIELFWMQGTYPSYTTWETGITCHPLQSREMQASINVELSSVLSGSDNTWRIYYGDAAGAAEENPAGVYGASDVLAWNGREATDTDISQVSDSTGSVADGTRTGSNDPYSLRARSREFWGMDFDGSAEINWGTGVNLANASELTVLCYLGYDGGGSDEHTVVNNWSSDKASFLLRIDPAASHQIEAFVRCAGNVQVGGNANTLTVTPGTGTVVGMTYSSAAGVIAWKNKSTQSVGTTGNGNFDADASPALKQGRNTAGAPTDDYFNGQQYALLVATTKYSDAWIGSWVDSHEDPEPGGSFWSALGSETLASGSSVSANQASEQNSAFAITIAKTKPIALSTEQDVSQSKQITKTRAVAIATEQDTAFAATWSKDLAIGLSAEQDSAFAATFAKTLAVGLPTEQDLALSATWAKDLSIGLNTEQDVPLAMTQAAGVAVGQSSEQDLATAFEWAKLLATGLATEQDTAFTVTTAKAKSIALASEQDLAAEWGIERTFSITVASEQDTAFLATWSKAMPAGLATEQDLALGITAPTVFVAIVDVRAGVRMFDSRACTRNFDTRTDDRKFDSRSVIR